MSIYFSLAFMSILHAPLYGQYVTPEILASAGGTFQAPDLNLQWTIGEIIVDDHEKSGQQIELGFHQGIVGRSIPTAISETQWPGLVSVLPNPASSWIEIQSEIRPPFRFSISGVLTNILRQGVLNDTSRIPVGDLRPGFYLITLFHGSLRTTVPWVKL